MLIIYGLSGGTDRDHIGEPDDMGDRFGSTKIARPPPRGDSRGRSRSWRCSLAGQAKKATRCECFGVILLWKPADFATLEPQSGWTKLGRLRIKLRDQLVEAGALTLPSDPHFLWITEFPLFTRSDEDKEFQAKGRWSSSHPTRARRTACDRPTSDGPWCASRGRPSRRWRSSSRAG